MKSVNPYLNFAGNTEEAFRFYQSVFDGELQIVRFKDLGDGMGATGDDLEKVANVALPIGGGTVLMGTDTLESFGQRLNAGNNFSITLETDTVEEAEKLFDRLSEGGNVMMPLAETEWAELYGMCTDKFGIQWMFNHTGSKDLRPEG